MTEPDPVKVFRCKGRRLKIIRITSKCHSDFCFVIGRIPDDNPCCFTIIHIKIVLTFDMPLTLGKHFQVQNFKLVILNICLKQLIVNLGVSKFLVRSIVYCSPLSITNTFNILIVPNTKIKPTKCELHFKIYLTVNSNNRSTMRV